MVRIGLIGFGQQGKLYSAILTGIALPGMPASPKPDGCVLTAVSARNEACKGQIEAMGVRYFQNWQDLVASDVCDAVVITVPHFAHHEIAIGALNAGKHVLCEKPLEINTERIDEIIEACDRNNVKLGCIFQMRVSPLIVELKREMESGRFGKMLLASANMRWYRDNDYYDSSNWRGTWKYDGGGALINQAVHVVDTLLYINGDVEAVSAFAGTFTHNIEVEDNLCATFKYRNGSFGTIEVSTCCAPGFPRRIAFSGSNGTVAIEEDKVSRWEFVDSLPEDEEIIKIFSGSSNENGGRSPLDISFTGHAVQIADFADAIRNDRTPKVDGREARRAIELICAIYESARTGKTVYLQGADK